MRYVPKRILQQSDTYRNQSKRKMTMTSSDIINPTTNYILSMVKWKLNNHFIKRIHNKIKSRSQRIFGLGRSHLCIIMLIWIQSRRFSSTILSGIIQIDSTGKPKKHAYIYYKFSFLPVFRRKIDFYCNQLSLQ